MNARCSVVIPHYGDPALALAVVDSLGRQTIPAHEVIVVDDASPTPFPVDVPLFPANVRVARREENGGFGRAVNTGASLATGDILVICNSDVCLDESFLEKLIAARLHHPDDLVAPAVVNAAGLVTWGCRLFPTTRNQLLQHVRVVSGLQFSGRYKRACGMDTSQWESGDGPTSTEWIAGVVLSLPLSTFRRIGGFCEDYFMYAEETDLQRRLAQMGVRRIHEPSVNVSHAEGGSSDPGSRGAWAQASLMIYARRWGRPLVLAVGLTAVSLVNLLLDVIRLMRGRDVSPLRSAWGLISGTWRSWWSTRAVRRAG